MKYEFVYKVICIFIPLIQILVFSVADVINRFMGVGVFFYIISYQLLLLKYIQ